jgi:hypothetical protein
VRLPFRECPDRPDDEPHASTTQMPVMYEWILNFPAAESGTIMYSMLSDVQRLPVAD